MTNSTVLAMSFADRWHGFWLGSIGDWILDRGVPIALYLIGGLLAARFINWCANESSGASTPSIRKATSWCARRAPSTARPSRR